MREEGIYNGDLLIVDRSLDPTPGDIVIAVIDGQFCVKRLAQYKDISLPELDNSKQKSITLNNEEISYIWGVIIYSIHQLKAPI